MIWKAVRLAIYKRTNSSRKVMLRFLFFLVFFGTNFLGPGQDLDSLENNIEYEISQVGVYKGKSLYIHNPFVRSDSGFCINEILVNNQPMNINLNSPAIEVSFRKDLMYKPVALRLLHKSNCVPKILNPDAIVIHSSFKFVELQLNDTMMTWTTKGDRDDGQFTVERLGAEIWNTDTVIQAKGEFKGASYRYYPLLTSGTNKFRIKYSLPSGRYLYSHELEHEYYPALIEISPLVVTTELTLSRAVDWEITTLEGRTIVKGKAKVIPLRRLKAGDYYIRLGEEQIESFIKK